MLDQTGTPRRGPEAARRAAWQHMRTQYDGVVLLLQGGGALGSYQGGVYEVLAETPFLPDWVAGISIGAVNAALIAGNPPERRVERLRDSGAGSPIGALVLAAGWRRAAQRRQPIRRLVGAAHRPAWLLPATRRRAVFPAGRPCLRGELVRHRTAAPDPAGAGRFRPAERRADTAFGGRGQRRHRQYSVFRHARAAARPRAHHGQRRPAPGFPPVEIDGEYYWDGSLVSNTPLQYVLDAGPAPTSLVFQVDLFSSRGKAPRTLPEADERAKDIRFSSRTRLVTDVYRRMHDMRCAIETLLAKLPEAMQADPEVQRIAAQIPPSRLNLLQLVYRQSEYDRDYKDYEFSRNTMLDHWQAGRNDLVRTLRHLDWLEPPDERTALVSHDVHFDAPG
ncbi:DUF3734 domain-containing protein [Siccirubricoccus deserti]